MAASPPGDGRPLRLESVSGADAAVAAPGGASVAIAGAHALPFTGTGEPLGAVYAGRPPTTVAYAPAASLLVTAHADSDGGAGGVLPAVQVFHVPPAAAAAAGAGSRLPPAARRVAHLSAADVGAPHGPGGGGCALVALSPDGRTLVTVSTPPPPTDGGGGAGAAQLHVWSVTIDGGGGGGEGGRPSTAQRQQQPPPPPPRLAPAPPGPHYLPHLKSPLDSLKARLRSGGGGNRRPSTALPGAVSLPAPLAPPDAGAAADPPELSARTLSPAAASAGGVPPHAPRTPTTAPPRVSLTHVGRGRVSQHLRRVAFAPDGSVVVTAGDGHLKLWRLPVPPLPSPQSSPAADQAAVSAPTAPILLRSLPATLTFEGPPVRAFVDVCVLQPSEQPRTPAADNYGTVHEAPPADDVEVCALSDDGIVCVFGSDGQLLRHARLPSPHDATAHCVSAAPGGECVCVGTAAGVVMLDRRSLAVTGVWRLQQLPFDDAISPAALVVSVTHVHVACAAGAVGFRPQATRLVVGTSDGAVTLCDAGPPQKDGQQLAPVRQLVRPRPSLLAAASASLPLDMGATSASSGVRRAVTLTCTDSGLVSPWPPGAVGTQQLHTAALLAAPLVSAAFSADGTLVAVANGSGACGLYDTGCSSDSTGGMPRVQLPSVEAGASPVTALAAGRLLPPSLLDGDDVTGSSLALPADLSEGGGSFQSAQPLGGTPAAGGVPLVPPAGLPLLAVGCSDGRITVTAACVYEQAPRQQLDLLPSHAGASPVTSVTVSADGRVIVTADGSGRVCVSRIAAVPVAGGDGGLQLQLRRQRTLSLLSSTVGIGDDACAADGAATACRPQLADGAATACRPQLALHPGGNYVAAVSGAAGDARVLIVSMRAGRVVRTLALPPPAERPPGGSCSLSSVAFDSSGLLMAAVWRRDDQGGPTADVTPALVTVVDFYCGQQLCGGAAIRAPSTAPVLAAFSADARRLLVAAVGGSASVWRLPRSLAAAAGERSDEAASSVCSRPSSARSFQSVRSAATTTQLDATDGGGATRRSSALLPPPLAAAASVTAASGSCASPVPPASEVDGHAGAGSPAVPPEAPPEEMPPSPSLPEELPQQDGPAEEPPPARVDEDLPADADDDGSTAAPSATIAAATLPTADDNDAAPVPEVEEDVELPLEEGAAAPAVEDVQAAASPPATPPDVATMPSADAAAASTPAPGNAAAGGSGAGAWWEITAISAVSPLPASGGSGGGVPYRGRSVSAVSAVTEDVAELPPRLQLPDSTLIGTGGTWAGTDTSASAVSSGCGAVSVDVDTAPSYLDGLLPLLPSPRPALGAQSLPALTFGAPSAVSTPASATPAPAASPAGAPPSLDLSVSLSYGECPTALDDCTAAAAAGEGNDSSNSAVDVAADQPADGCGPPSATTCRLLTTDHADGIGGTVTPAYLRGHRSPAFHAIGGSVGGALSPAGEVAAAAAAEAVAALDSSLAAALAVLCQGGGASSLASSCPPSGNAALLRSLRAARDAIDAALATYGSGVAVVADQDASAGGVAECAAAAGSGDGPVTDESGELPAYYLQAS